jgi:Ni,Fe-hydrogenase maturation factor
LAKELNVQTTKCIYNGDTIEIIQNPLQRRMSPILLLPQDILRKLPFASTWDDIVDTTNFNSTLRSKVNHYISQTWKAKTKKAKERQLAVLMKNKDGVNTLIEVINTSKVKPYDFEIDEDSVMFPKRVAEIISENPLEISSENNTAKELQETVKAIVGQFKFLIENKGINTLLWKRKSEPNNEKTTQKIFLSVAYSYCKANDIDINPEMDTGRGNVDFKFSKGFSRKIVVEIKHSYNQNIIDGFAEQLQLYKKSEETAHGYYIIVDVGKIGKKYERLTEMYNNDPGKRAEIIYIDGHLKPSASKIKSKNKRAEIQIVDTMHEIPELEFPKFEELKITLNECEIAIDKILKDINDK